MNKMAGFLALAMSAPMAIAASPPETPTFCERLAPQLGMKEVTKRGSTQRAWKTEQMGMLKKHLIGGSTMMSFGVEPGSTDDVRADMSRASQACRQVKKSMVCRPEAPDTLVVGTQGSEGRVELREGEKPVVETRGTAIYCRNS